ncbi:MAG: TonB-dependent receptor [Deltaproteobacteria bacterium]|nr:TonB-dependent receptor [Deltaproteobacteria bacterium]
MNKLIKYLIFLYTVTNWQLVKAQETNTEKSPILKSDVESTSAAKQQIPVYETVVISKKSIERDKTQSTTIVDGELLRSSSQASMLEALAQQSADIYVSARGTTHGVANGASGGIHIRGLGGSPNSQVLVVEDNVPDYQSIFGHPIPDEYVPSLIDEVLVIKGGDSVLYGSNAMAGVIILRSRWLTHEGYELQNDTAYGSYETLRETVSFLSKTGAFDIAAAVHALSSDGHRLNAGGNNVIATTAARYLITPNLKVSFRNKLVHIKGADPGPASHPNADNWYDVWRDNVSAELLYKYNEYKLTSLPYLTYGIHKLYDGFYSIDYIMGNKIEAQYEPSKIIKILLGVDPRRIDGRVKNRITKEHQKIKAMNEISFYSQVTVQPINWLTGVFGMRALNNTRYGSVFLYKSGLRLDLVEGLNLFARVTKNFRQPTIRELYLPYPTANPNLKPEYSTNEEAGVKFNSKYFEASCAGYRSDAHNLIKYFGAWPSAEVINIDNIMIWGIEATAKLKNIGPFTMHLSADWQDVGRYTRQNPSTKVNFAINFKHEFSSHRFNADINSEWVSGLYMNDYSRQAIKDVVAINLSLRYRYQIPDRKLSVEPYVILRNLLNQRYAYIKDYPMPGFNVLAGMRITM